MSAEDRRRFAEVGGYDQFRPRRHAAPAMTEAEALAELIAAGAAGVMDVTAERVCESCGDVLCGTCAQFGLTGSHFAGDGICPNGHRVSEAGQ